MIHPPAPELGRSAAIFFIRKRESMSHQYPYALLPGERLEVGEYLVSADGRFRLYREANGSTALYSYRIDHGRWSLWGIAAPNPIFGAGTYLTLPTRGPAAVVTSDGTHAIWQAQTTGRGVTNTELVIQDDGNLVQYGTVDGNGSTIALWATGTYADQHLGPVSVPPNSHVIEIYTQGTLILGTGQGDGEVVNTSGQTLGARSPTQFVSVPSQQPVSVVNAGEVSLEIVEYNFTLLGGNGPNGVTTGRRSGEAAPRRTPNGGRWKMSVSPGMGLRFPPALDILEGSIAVDLSDLLEEQK
jgi:hypothetical protein